MPQRQTRAAASLFVLSTCPTRLRSRATFVWTAAGLPTHRCTKGVAAFCVFPSRLRIPVCGRLGSGCQRHHSAGGKRLLVVGSGRTASRVSPVDPHRLGNPTVFVCVCRSTSASSTHLSAPPRSSLMLPRAAPRATALCASGVIMRALGSTVNLRDRRQPGSLPVTPLCSARHSTCAAFGSPT